MHLSTLLLTLPALAAAADQVPLKEKASGWLNKAKSYVDSARPVAQGPINAAASAVTAKRVHKFTHANYDAKLSPSSQNPANGPEDWLILATGGNKTCFGRCEIVDRAWNASHLQYSASFKPLLTSIDSYRSHLSPQHPILQTSESSIVNVSPCCAPLGQPTSRRFGCSKCLSLPQANLDHVHHFISKR